MVFKGFGVTSLNTVPIRGPDLKVNIFLCLLMILVVIAKCSVRTCCVLLSTVSQMDGDHYVSVSVIAQFTKVCTSGYH